MENRKLSALLNTPLEAAKRFPLLRRFSITSLVAMLITAAILVFLYRQDQLAEHEEVAAQNSEKTATHLMLLLDDQINTLVATSNGFDIQALQTNPNIALFTAALERVREHDMLKLKIYNLSGTAIYSSVRGEIGATSKHQDMLAKALSGEVAHRLDFRDTFSGAAGEMHDIYISATYMALAHAGKRIGVIEVYADATPFFKRLHATLFQIFLIVLGVFAVLYAALFLFLLRADRAIAEWQKAITDSEERFRKITESAQDAIIMMGADQRILFWNAAAERIFGYTATEAIGQELHALIAPASVRAGFTQTYPHFQETGEGPIIGKLREVTALRKGGEEFPVELSVSATQFGGQWHAIGIVRDITGRKQSEEFIRESEARYRKIFELAADIIYLLNPDGTFRSLNPAFERITGWKVEEWIGKPFALIVHPDDLPVASAAFQKALSGESIPSFRLRVARKSGPYFNAEIIITPFEGDMAMGIARDITERMQAEEVLRKSEAEFRTLAEAMPQIVWITRPDGWNIYFNQQWMDYTGLTLEESLGHGWNKPFHPDDQQRAWDAWQQATTTNGIYSIESRLRRADGVYRWWLVRGVPLLDADGNILKWFGTCTDINDIKMAELEISRINLELRESDRRFSDLLENVDLISMMLDREARITYCNEYLLRLTGWKREEIIGENWFDIFAPPELNYLKDSFFGTVLANQPEVRHHENEILTRSGECRLIRWNNSALRSGDGDVIGTASIGEDITERKRAEESLRKLSQAVEQSPSSIIIANLDAKIEYVNAAFLRTTGYSLDEVIGNNPRLLQSGKTPKASYEQMWASLKRGESWQGEFINRRKDGSEYVESVLMSPVRQADGSVTHYLAIKEDITQRKLDENHLTEQLEELRRWHDVTSGREGRILVLKHEVNELLVQAGQPPRYPSAEAIDETEK